MLAATAAATIGVALLYASWRQRVEYKAAVLWAAWLFIAASVGLWVIATGPEFGPVIALLTLGGTLYLPWQEADRLALTVLLIPFVWGVFSFWAAADPRLARPAIGLAVGGSLGGALLFGA